MQHHAAGSGRGVVVQETLAGSAVSISSPGRPPPWTSPRGGAAPDFVWAVHAPTLRGSVAVNKSMVVVDMASPRLAVRLASTKLTPWNAARPRDGPEGWLGYVESLLPCRYFVHALGGPAAFVVDARAAAGVGRGSGARSASYRVRGDRAQLHAEGNNGRSFPRAWTWIQAFGARPGDAFVAVGGRFRVGVLPLRTWIIALRLEGLRWDFRTVHLDSVRARLEALPRTARGNSSATLDAVSRDGTRRVLISVHAPAGDFGAPVSVPTPAGFSDAPGCVEAHTATLRVKCFRWDGAAWAWVRDADMRMAALEFGGRNAQGL